MKQCYVKTVFTLFVFSLLACYQNSEDPNKVVSEPVVTFEGEALKLETENIRSLINNKRFSGLIHAIDDDRQL